MSCWNLHCKSGLVPHSLMYATDIGGIPLDPPAQLLIWSHCSSSIDPSTLLLEAGRQVVLGHHLTLNYWLSRYFLCRVWIVQSKTCQSSVSGFTAKCASCWHLHSFTPVVCSKWARGCKGGLVPNPHLAMRMNHFLIL